MVIRSALPSLGSSQRQILYFGQRRDYKGDGVSPSVVLRLSNCLQSWNVTLLSQSISIWRASAPYSYTVCYCINCTVCTVFIYCIQYCTLTWYELRFINDLARKRTVCTYTVYTVYILYIYMANVLFTKLRWVFPKMPQDALKTSLICFQNAANHSKFSSLRKSKVYVHDTTLRSQNAEQLRENGWLRCSRTPQSFKTGIFYIGVWSLEFWSS